jgi:hypothetical protein
MTIIAPPPPPAVAPPPLTDSGRRAVRVALTLAAALLVLGTIAGLTTVALGVSSLRVSTDTAALPAGMRSLTVDGAASPVAIRIKTDESATEARVDLRLLDASRDGEQRLDVTTDGSGTRVSLAPPPASFMPWRRGGEITVTLPPEAARRLSVTTEQADGVLFVDADLDQLTARTTDGAVLLRGGARKVDVTVRDADVVAQQPISVTESFVVNSVDGDVTVGFAKVAPRTIEAVTRDGDVTLSLPPTGPYLVHTQSRESTMVRVPETSDPARAVAEVTVRADDGSVVLRTGR